jgi:hypothetical protein
MDSGDAVIEFIGIIGWLCLDRVWRFNSHFFVRISLPGFVMRRKREVWGGKDWKIICIW